MVVVRSWVETLSLSSTGTPWSGPRTLPARRSSSSRRALASASGSVSITEREAVKLNVIDLVADSIPDLLAKVDGRAVKTAKGTVTLATKAAMARPIEIGARDRFLNVITDPSDVYPRTSNLA